MVGGEKVSEEVTNLLIQMIKDQGAKIDKLEGKVDELIALKNRVMAVGVVFSVIFAYVFDWFRGFWGK